MKPLAHSRYVQFRFATLAAITAGACGDLGPGAPDGGSPVAATARALGTGSCVGRCGGASSDCYCDSVCASVGDCCDDKVAACGGAGPDAGSAPGGGCAGHCGGSAGACWCDASCVGFGDCCSNYAQVCSAGPAPSSPPPAGFTLLPAGTTVGGSVAYNGQIRYAYPRVSGRTYAVVLIPGGDVPSGADIDLYVGESGALSTSSWSCRPYLVGATPEVCTSSASANGWGFVMVHGFAAGTYTLSVFEQGGPAPVAQVFDMPVNPPSAGGWYDAQPFLTGRHLGADLNRTGDSGANSDLGAVVFAVADGTVTYAANAGPAWNGVMIVRHNAGMTSSFSLPGGGSASTVYSLYGHLHPSWVSNWLHPGDTVRRGQPIGVVGPTPSTSSGPHLHWEMRTADLPPGTGYADSAMGRISPQGFVAVN